MKKIYMCVLLLFLCLMNKGICQKSPFSSIGYDSEPDITLFQIHIKELDTLRTPLIIRGGGVGSFAGSLIDGIKVLLELTSDRIKVKGVLPNKIISISSQTVLPDINNINNIILNTLAYQYKFKVEDSKDTCDVWILSIDDDKIPLYSSKRDGNNTYARPSEDNKYWLATGIPVYILRQVIEKEAQHTVVDKIQNDKQYNLVIPYSVMKNFENLSAYLKKEYNINLTKQRMLLNTKIIIFE